MLVSYSNSIRQCFGKSPVRNLFARIRDIEYTLTKMIRTFACRDTELLFNSHAVKRFKNIERVARRKLLMIHAATVLDTLKVPPGNRLESLDGDRKGQYSIRINDQWRVCFQWADDGVYQVEIVDYH